MRFTSEVLTSPPFNLVLVFSDYISVFISGTLFIISFHGLCFHRLNKGIYSYTFKVLDHIHNSYLKVCVLCVSNVTFLRAYCSGAAVFCYRDIVLTVNGCIFVLVSRHLGLGSL